MRLSNPIQQTDQASNVMRSALEDPRSETLVPTHQKRQFTIDLMTEYFPEIMNLAGLPIRLR